MGSPAAASKPAETTLGWTMRWNTNDELRVEFVRNGHDYFLEGVDIICIAYVPDSPWYIHISMGQKLREKRHTFRDPLLLRNTFDFWLTCLLGRGRIYEGKYTKHLGLL
jgi:hypothetical protein